ncbi:Alpha-ketoglutarate-dependent sulfonate dioxygenase [Mycena kentingensis (nom. inval.)]|nr:Alpha-ketoglutarate-dependent sulfonate dioxygenase [Mycena kentingensis (nom. inval.)]
MFETLLVFDSMSDAKETQTSNGRLIDPVDQYQNFFQSNSLGVAAREEGYKYSHLLPTFPTVDWGVAPYYDNISDAGLRVPKETGWRNGSLSKRPGIKFVELTPVIGTEIHGLDLRTLTSEEKDEIALLAAERGVIAFRGQPKEFSLQDQTELVKHFGPLHIHGSSGTPEDPSLAHVHVVYKDAGKRAPPGGFSKVELWHTDVSYEVQTPGITSFQVITNPPSGGDTLFASAYSLYDALSPGMRTFVEGLSAMHSGLAQGNKEQLRHQRRPGIETIHPVVRVHPVTGWKSLYVDPASTRYIVGLPKGESEMLLNYLWGLTAMAVDCHVRVKYDEDTVVLWDNRTVVHAATFDFWPYRRHAVRVMSIAERPASVEDAKKQWGIEAKSREDDIVESQGWKDLVAKLQA